MRNRAVAVGEADGPQAGLAALAGLDPSLPRHAAVAAYLPARDHLTPTGRTAQRAAAADTMCPLETSRDRLRAAAPARCWEQKVEPPKPGQVERLPAGAVAKLEELIKVSDPDRGSDSAGGGDPAACSFADEVTAHLTSLEDR